MPVSCFDQRAFGRFRLCRWRTNLHVAGLRSFTSRLKQLRDQSGPASLMRCAHAASGVAVKVFVEQHVIAEVWVSRELGMILEDWSLAVLPFEEHLGQAT